VDDDELFEELEIPDGVAEADEYQEIMRVWVSDGVLRVVFDPDTFQHDVSEWGRVLSDIVQNLALAVELDGQMDRNEALEKIREGFEIGLGSQTETLTGAIKGRTTH